MTPSLRRLALFVLVTVPLVAGFVPRHLLRSQQHHVHSCQRKNKFAACPGFNDRSGVDPENAAGNCHQRSNYYHMPLEEFNCLSENVNEPQIEEERRPPPFVRKGKRIVQPAHRVEMDRWKPDVTFYSTFNLKANQPQIDEDELFNSVVESVNRFPPEYSTVLLTVLESCQLQNGIIPGSLFSLGLLTFYFTIMSQAGNKEDVKTLFEKIVSITGLCSATIHERALLWLTKESTPLEWREGMRAKILRSTAAKRSQLFFQLGICRALELQGRAVNKSSVKEILTSALVPDKEISYLLNDILAQWENFLEVTRAQSGSPYPTNGNKEPSATSIRVFDYLQAMEDLTILNESIQSQSIRF